MPSILLYGDKFFALAFSQINFSETKSLGIVHMCEDFLKSKEYKLSCKLSGVNIEVITAYGPILPFRDKAFDAIYLFNRLVTKKNDYEEETAEKEIERVKKIGTGLVNSNIVLKEKHNVKPVK